MKKFSRGSQLLENNIFTLVINRTMINAESNCRVDKPNDCQVLGMNKWGRGFGVHKKYKDIKYYQNGMQIYRPEDGLTIYQRRDFLTPEYYDSGCMEPFCPQKRVCPDGKLAGETPQETNMFDYFFASTDPFILNGGPINCVGIKDSTANAYLGWYVKPGSNKPVWMENAQRQGVVGTCPGEKVN